MNIFVSDQNPVTAAKNLDDIRLNKMIVESSQLLSTALNLRGIQAPYSSVDTNHPVSMWVRDTRGNYKWLFQHFVAMLSEYNFRNGKLHACHAFVQIFRYGIDRMPNGQLQPFYNNSNNRNEPNTIEAYRTTLKDKWDNDKNRGRIPTWTNRNKPVWYKN